MNHNPRLVAALSLILAVSIAGCAGASSSGANDASSGDPMSADGGMSDDGGADAGATAPVAPTITMLMKMGGGLHVNWKNATKDCDSIIGERRAGTDAYATVFTVPGAADNKMDGTLTAGTTYTYRLHCVRGGISSPFSNEMSGTP